MQLIILNTTHIRCSCKHVVLQCSSSTEWRILERKAASNFQIKTNTFDHFRLAICSFYVRVRNKSHPQPHSNRLPRRPVERRRTSHPKSPLKTYAGQYKRSGDVNATPVPGEKERSTVFEISNLVMTLEKSDLSLIVFERRPAPLFCSVAACTTGIPAG